MNTVENIKRLCKERNVPVSRLERDLGFANGYIGQLRKGTVPDDRLEKIADYFGISINSLMDREDKVSFIADIKEANLESLIERWMSLPESKRSMLMAYATALCDMEAIDES